MKNGKMKLTSDVPVNLILSEKKSFESMQDKLKMQNSVLKNKKDYEKKSKLKIKPRKKK